MKLFQTLILLVLVGMVACKPTDRKKADTVTPPTPVCNNTVINGALPQIGRGATYERLAYIFGTQGVQYKKTVTDDAGNVTKYFKWYTCTVDTSYNVIATFVNDSLTYVEKTSRDTTRMSVGVDSINYLAVDAAIRTHYLRTYDEVRRLFGVEGDLISRNYYYGSSSPSYYSPVDSTATNYYWYHPGGGYVVVVFKGDRVIYTKKNFIQGK